MQPASVNRALLNRANPNHAIEQLNNRIDGVVESMGGIDIMFKKTDIKSSDFETILGDMGLKWLDSAAMLDAVIYEAQAPSSRISNLRPAGMLKGRIVGSNGVFIGDVYQPLNQFVRNPDDSISFKLENSSTTKNQGGNIRELILDITTTTSPGKLIDMNALNTAISESSKFNINNLYYVSFSDYMANAVSGANNYTESITLHFE